MAHAQKDKLYHKQKSGSNKDRCHFKQVKILVQRKIKTAHENYLADKGSCETQLIQLVEDLGRQLTLGKQEDLVLFDFSKAFNKVNHLKLLYKLACFGIKGNTLKWIQSFLIGRTQTVVLDGESSNEVPVTSGIPPGVCTGPAPLSIVHK